MGGVTLCAKSWRTQTSYLRVVIRPIGANAFFLTLGELRTTSSSERVDKQEPRTLAPVFKLVDRN